VVAVPPPDPLERLCGQVGRLGPGVGDAGAAEGEQFSSPRAQRLEQGLRFGQGGGGDGVFEAGPLALERGGVAGGEELAEVFLDAPRDGEFDVLLEDLGEAGALPDGEPVVGAGEQLPVRPGGESPRV
jgi:hypothetical protein